MIRRLVTRVVILLAPVATLASGAFSLQDWPEFRGPAGQGIGEGASPPVQWEPETNIAWRRELPGAGWSSPVVAGGKVFLTAALLEGDAPKSLRALCIDGETGAIDWNVEAIPWTGSPQKHPKNGYASPTPIVSEGRVYVHFGPWGTACLEADGTVVWRQTALYYPTPHGNGGSPVLHGGKLIFSCDAEESPFVVALDAKTGEVAWKQVRDTEASKKFSFCTPALIPSGDATLAVSPGSGYVAAYDTKNGAEAWRFYYGEGFSIVPRPVVYRDLVYVATGFARPSNVLAIRTGGQGDVTGSHLAWKSEEGTPHTPSMLVVGDELYFMSDRGTFSCVDAATGVVHYREDVGGRFSASLVYGDGRIYATNEDGTTLVLRAGTSFELLAENALGERTFASLALCGEVIFLRTETALYRIEGE